MKSLAHMNDETNAPRDNGELVFDAPWQARSLAMALALVEHADLAWDEFRQRLIDAIAESPERAYYESWAVALESLVVSLGLTTPAELEAAATSREGS